MKCRCGRIMGWCNIVGFNRPKEIYGRKFHCPKCYKSRKECDCPKLELPDPNLKSVSEWFKDLHKKI